jgi:quercetin dioxygenase-like cupin family protein
LTYSRRDFCLLVPALAASPGFAAEATLLKSKALPYDELPVRKRDGNESRPVLAGQLHDGGYIEVHETRLAPGGMPHPAHHHVHEEMFLVREGTVELTVNQRATRLGAGSVGFVASNDEHGLKNVGTTPAQYFVVALGKDA